MRTGSCCLLVIPPQAMASERKPFLVARAFFYAGARSLVVSHWDVLDDGTALLMSDLFKRSSQYKSLSRAGVRLQRAAHLIGESGPKELGGDQRNNQPMVAVG